MTGTRTPRRGGQAPGGAPDAAGNGFSFAVGRASGTVVVTVHGRLDGTGSGVLGDALVDLIDNQGNLDIVVDLRDVRADGVDDVAVFARAARCAGRRGTSLVLADPTADLAAALEAAGLRELTVHRPVDGHPGVTPLDDRRGGRTGPRVRRRPDGSPPAATDHGPRD